METLNTLPQSEDKPSAVPSSEESQHSSNILLAEMTELFLEDYPRLLSLIWDSIAHHDSTALEYNAHTLKGSASEFSANSAVEAAFRLEEMGHNNDMVAAKKAYATLEGEMERLGPVLSAILRKDI